MRKMAGLFNIRTAGILLLTAAILAGLTVSIKGWHMISQTAEP